MQRFWDASIALRGIDTGPANSSKHMLVYFDPDCPVCARQWQALKPYLAQVRIHWIPVAVMDANSQRRSAAILAAPDPAAALTANEDHYDFRTHSGGYMIPMSIPEWALQAVSANTSSTAWAQPFIGVPMLGFELYNGKRHYRRTGLLDAQQASVLVQELGDTMDPWQRTQAIAKAEHISD